MSIPLISFFFILIGFTRPEPAPLPFGDLVSPVLRSLAVDESSAATDPVGSGDASIDAAKFYELRGYSPAWVLEGGLTPAGEELLGLFRASGLQGLEPRAYYPAELEALLADYHRISAADRAQRAREAARLDLALTTSFLRFARHTSVGRVDPHRFEPKWPVAPQAPGFVEGLVNRLEVDGPGEAVRSVEARHPIYQRLMRALREYRAIYAAGGWEEIPDGPELAPGSKGTRVAMVRKRLQLNAGGPDSAAFDANLAAAVERFQRLNGLKPTRKVDRPTLAELNVPVEKRIGQIELSLERARWLPSDFGARYILVNIPEAVLRVVERDSVVFSTRAVVGKAGRQTPVLVDTMTSLVLNPSWNLPPVVVDEDVLPKLTKNTDYLKQKNIKVYQGWGKEAREINPDSVRWARWTSRTMPYNLRMEPGPANALGRVKFLFPNDEHIYIHDSPQRSLYSKEQRLYSSGCVRVERARDLAAYLLGESPRWDRERLAEAFAAGEERSVALRKPIPVYLIYLTAWVGADGAMHFRPDLYGRDESLAGMLADGASPS